MEDLKLKLIESIIKTNDLTVLNQIKNILFRYSSAENRNVVAEEQAVYQTEKPMTDEEVEEYFREEEIELPAEILEILKFSQKQVENGEYYTQEEMQNYFEEWLKD
ncbi:MAG: hypothetical protein QM564_06080 [Bergeyella sp.]